MRTLLRGPGVAAALASLAVAAVLSCASPAAPAPKPAPSEPGAEVIAALTAGLKLDPAQQQKTRELFQDMMARDERIRAGWANGERVRPEMLAASHGQFERDFLAILTEEQRKVFIENRTRLLLQARGVRS
jgi:hypothetical protein